MAIGGQPVSDRADLYRKLWALVPRGGSIDPIDGGQSVLGVGAARGAMPCASGKCRNAAQGPRGPTAHQPNQPRDPLPARRVASRLWWTGTTAQLAPNERANYRDQWGQYFRPSVLGSAGIEVPLTLLGDGGLRDVAVTSADRYRYLKIDPSY